MGTVEFSAVVWTEPAVKSPGRLCDVFIVYNPDIASDGANNWQMYEQRLREIQSCARTLTETPVGYVVRLLRAGWS